MKWFHDQKRGILIYEMPSPLHASQLLHALPEAREVDSKYVAVPATLANSQVLRRHQYPVAPIITDDSYKWPATPGVKPWPHQKVAANFAALHPRSFNLSAMGSGKTNSFLWATDFLMDQFPKGTCRTLIVAPLSTLQSVWGSAIFSHLFGKRTYVVLHGTAERRLELLKQDVDYYLINHDGVGVGARTRPKFELAGFSKALAARADIRICVLDEASAYRDATTKRHRIARMVLGTRDYLFALTGTPTPSRPTDAYGIARLLNNAFGKSFRDFRMESEYQVSQFKWEPRKDGYERARALLSPSIRFELSEVWPDAPELIYQTREAELTKEQITLMAALKRDLQVVLKSGKEVTAANEAAVRSKFLQISSGAVYDENHKAHAIDVAPRLAVLKEILDEAPRKVLLLASFTSVLTLLKKELKNYSTEVVNGEVSPKERAEIFRKFQDAADPEIIIADPGVLAHGLNLQRGRTIIWFSTIDKGEIYEQANARCHRPGQKFDVNVVQIVSNPLEKEIYKRLASNASMQGLLLQMVARGEL
jgi:SNF2 family DNA or RNA helicase